MKPEAILLIEDNPADARLVVEALEDLSASSRVTRRSTAEEAMVFLRTQIHAGNPLPDLILMDLHLPGKDGKDLLMWLQGEGRLERIPVAVLTGSLDASERAALETCAVICWRIKPPDLEGYHGLMKEILDACSMPPQKREGSRP